MRSGVLGEALLAVCLLLPRPGLAAPAAPEGAAGAQAEPIWELQPYVDQASKQARLRAVMVQRTLWGSEPGRVEVVASCGGGGGGVVRLEFWVFSSTSKHRGFFQQEQWGGGYDYIEKAEVVRPVGPNYVQYTVQVDGRPAEVLSSADEYGNLAHVDFPVTPGDVKRRTGYMGARRLRVVLPLDNGYRQAVDLQPGEGSFVDFASRCFTSLTTGLERGYLGVHMQPVDGAQAVSLGLPAGTPGAAIAAILPRGPAATSDLAPGDVILEIDGQALGKPEDALARIPGLRPGRTASFTVWRAGKRREVKVRIGAVGGPAFVPRGARE